MKAHQNKTSKAYVAEINAGRQCETLGLQCNRNGQRKFGQCKWQGYLVEKPWPPMQHLLRGMLPCMTE